MPKPAHTVAIPSPLRPDGVSTAPPKTTHSPRPLKPAADGPKSVSGSVSATSHGTKRVKPRTFRELLEESQGPVRERELEKDRESKANEREIEKLMRG